MSVKILNQMKRKLIWITCTLLIFGSVGMLVSINRAQVSATDMVNLGFPAPPMAGSVFGRKIQEKTVRGTSLFPLIKPGQEIKLLYGYYDYQAIEREDIVAYDYAGRENPIIKIIKAIPKDEFYLEKTSNGWHIFVNNKILKNSENTSYLLSEKGHQMLALYWQNYKGIIPENAYLLLGNLVSGSLDSSRFGLIDKSDILGKVEF